MIYYGPVSVDVSSYSAFRSAVIGNGYEFDYLYGCQCVDLAKVLNYNLGYSPPYYDTGGAGGVGYAYGGWTVPSARNFNASQCQLVYNLSDVKRGDLVIFNGSTDFPSGHVALADEDYNGGDTLKCLGQNQSSGEILPEGGTVVTSVDVGISLFLGAFRYNAWSDTPIPPIFRRGQFPWHLISRKKRNKNIFA